MITAVLAAGITAAVPSGAAAASPVRAARDAATPGQSPLAPAGLLHHSTRSATPSAGEQAAALAHAPQPAAQAAAQAAGDITALGPPLPLGSLPLGAYVTNQFEKYGILFSGQSPFITDDGASTVNPTLSGSPLFSGTVVGTFVKPGTTTPATVNAFSLDVGYIDSPDSTQMTVYDSQGRQLGVLQASQLGFNQLYSTFPGAASFSVSSVANEPAGWEINTIQVGPPDTTYAALGDSYSSGEGSRDYPWSQSQGTQCDTGPEAWPAQMADETNGPDGPELTIGADTLIACQGETTKTLGQARIGENASELDQLRNYVSNHQDAPPTLVTLTIGGNDLGFATVLATCFAGGTEACLAVVANLDRKVGVDGGSLIATLSRSYAEVRSAGGDAQVVVVGYPNLFPQPGGAGTAIDVTENCPWMRDTLVQLFGRGLWVVSPLLNVLLAHIYDAQAVLNDDMLLAAAQAGVQFAPIPASLAGHELCTDDSWINPISVFDAGLFSNSRNSGHPTVTGQAAMAAAVAPQLGLDAGDGPGDVPGIAPADAAGAPQAGHVRAAALPARQQATGGGPLGVSGGALPGGTVGAPYAGYLISTGGTGADSWQVASGSLPPGLTLASDTGMISGTPTAAGTYTFRAAVTDSSPSAAQHASAMVSITVSRPGTLQIAKIALPDATVGQPYGIGLASSGGLGAVTWSVRSGALPTGLQLNSSTGQLTGSPTAAGPATFTVRATDSATPAQTATASESLTVDPASAPLRITTASLPGATAGDDYVGQLTSSGGTAPVHWSVTAGGLPPGTSLDPQTGQLAGTPTAAGTFGFTAQAADSASPAGQASAKLSITIGAAAPLAITTTAALGGTEGDPYSTTFEATGGAGPYRWSVSSGNLPAGISLDPATGQLHGTPAASGSSSFGITVTDAAGHAASGAFSVAIARVPLTVSAALPPATVGSYYAANLTPGGGVTPYQYSLASGTLPSGLTFDSGAGAIVGTPTQSGSFPLKVNVSDSSAPSQAVSAQLTLKVAAAGKLTVSGQVLMAGAVSVPYTTGVGFSGGLGPYTWGATAGSLPPGLTIDPGSGMITGTPTATGSYRVTVTVTDSGSPAETASATIPITIRKTPRLALRRQALPAAAQGSQYAAALTASGGIGPYSWSVTGGALPAGLQLGSGTGEITGTPVRAGRFRVTVRVSDAASPAHARSRVLTLQVDPAAPLEVTTSTLSDAVEGTAYSATLGADGGVTPYTWSVAGGGLPAGLQLGPDGTIAGTPSSYGWFTVTVRVTDSAAPAAGSVTRVLTLFVAPPG